jgi:hypothetical protein
MPRGSPWLNFSFSIASPEEHETTSSLNSLQVLLREGAAVGSYLAHNKIQEEDPALSRILMRTEPRPAHLSVASGRQSGELLEHGGNQPDF